MVPLMNFPSKIRIGTRGSRLAIAQAEEVKKRLLAACPELGSDRIEIEKIVTTGDRIQDRHLAEIGGKGLFTKEIEEGLFEGRIDIAVHSMKDMPDTLPEGLVIDCILEREDPRDAFISTRAMDIISLPKESVVGTSSIRRQSQILNIRPDLRIVPFRGNVGTRLDKLRKGDVDATILAMAGMKRIGLAGEVASVIDTEIMLPAVAQGAIGVECLASNEKMREILSEINHQDSFVRIKAERSYLKTLNGSCSTPIAGLAEFLPDGKLQFRGLVSSVDGKEIYKVMRTGSRKDAEEMGRDGAEEILRNAKSAYIGNAS